MTSQLSLILKVLTHPKSTFQALPSDRWLVLAWAAPLYFGVARAFRAPTFDKAVALFGGPLGLFLFVLVLGAIILPIVFWILKQVLKIFQKRLTVRKLMNIYGYSLVPRLIVAGIGYLFLVFFRSSFVPASGVGILFLIAVALGMIGMCYTIFLFIYGIVVSPSINVSHSGDKPVIPSDQARHNQSVSGVQVRAQDEY